MHFTLHLARCARRFANRIALADADRRMSFRELDASLNCIANGLYELGLQKGDRVALLSKNCMELLVAEYAVYRAGLVSVPLNARLAMGELAHMLNNAQAQALVLGPEHIAPFQEVQTQVPGIKHLITIAEAPPTGMIAYQDLLTSSATPPSVDLDMDDLCSLRYTSGTTGVLKAAIHTHRNRLASTTKRWLTPGADLTADSVACHVGPVTHASGSIVTPIWWAGGRNLILNGFNPRGLLETVQREGVTHMFAAPTMINMLMNLPDIDQYDLGSLKTVFYGASPMPVAHLQQALEIFGPIFIQSYGQTETASVIASLLKEEHVAEDNDPQALKRLGSCGLPNPLCDVRVVNAEGEAVAPGEVGEIISRGPDSMLGYWRDPELTRNTLIDGWLHTRDMATVDADGYIYIVDRKSDMIISGGFNIYPSEVENALCIHPAVYEACVVGVPDELWGESVKACVVLRANARATADELIEHCKEQISSYKKPKSIDFLAELPKNANGKLLRRKLKDRFWSNHDRRVH